MIGVILFRDIAAHPYTVVHEYGWRVLFRCCRFALDGRPHTFLDAITGRR